ncbi:hypothetical protein MW887_003491 [Aspergillus wentii]|nr:hypothetical protein MW887_003491 [Aspergillus wentii]
MPPLPPYEYTGPVDCTVAPDPSSLKDKSVIITGGANGMGEAIARTLASHGAFVTIGDVNEERGNGIAAEYPNIQFVKCDVRNWDEQVNLFKSGIEKSPQKSCDIAIANAGIAATFKDSLVALDDPHGEPVKPDLNIMDVNMNGVLYTQKLAMHYFRAQPDDESRDRCFIITSSLAAYLDFPHNWEYVCAKHAIKALMRCSRHLGWQQGIRINTLNPYFMKTTILSDEVHDVLESKGVEYALPEDGAAAVVKIACDRTITGRSFYIVPRATAKEGFLDGDQDDHQGSPEYIKEFQKFCLAGVEQPWE